MKHSNPNAVKISTVACRRTSWPSSADITTPKTWKCFWVERRDKLRYTGALCGPFQRRQRQWCKGVWLAGTVDTRRFHIFNLKSFIQVGRIATIQRLLPHILVRISWSHDIKHINYGAQVIPKYVWQTCIVIISVSWNLLIVLVFQDTSCLKLLLFPSSAMVCFRQVSNFCLSITK